MREHAPRFKQVEPRPWEKIIAAVLVAAASLIPGARVFAADHPSDATTFALATANGVDDPPPTTILIGDNDFYPEQRSLSDCMSLLERPGCGSPARGGTLQAILFVILLCGLAFIAWRIWAGGRRQRRAATTPSSDDEDDTNY